ncbi:hypothetical protein M1349_00030 [Patescibacteria group bacterium]|nr:hypothetical protein [Patescibacteria group bacterium]
MCDIIPGILEKDWPSIEEKIHKVKDFSKTIHIDIIDGKFAPNTTFLDPKPFKKYSDKILFEVHMMVDEPINYLQSFANAGFKRFLGHIERMSDQVDFVSKAQNLGEVVLAIDGPTSIEAVKVDYQDLDGLLVMTIKAGFSGQKFMPEYLEKIKKIVKKVQDEQLDPLVIEVDGGINDQTMLEAKKAGASRFITTSYLFNGEPKKNYKKLKDLSIG